MEETEDNCIFRDIQDGVYFCHASKKSAPTFELLCLDCIEDREEDD